MKYLTIVSFFLLILTPHMYGNKQGDRYLTLYINGPSITKHFTSYSFNDFHPGVGLACHYHMNRFIIGFHAHYMDRDSNNLVSFWGGAVLGYRGGNINKFWCEPSIILGGLKKVEINNGKLGPFAMPLLSLGYKWLGLNLAFIPKISEDTCPLVIVQFKIRIFLKSL